MGNGSKLWEPDFLVLGLINLPDSADKFRAMVEHLAEVQRAIQADGFTEAPLRGLKYVYGAQPCSRGVYLVHQCNYLRNRRNKEGLAALDEERKWFLEQVDTEIASFRRLLDLMGERDLTRGCLRDAAMLPSPAEATVVARYQAMLERQFQDGLRQMGDYRKMKQAALPETDMKAEDPSHFPLAEASEGVDNHESEPASSD